MRKDTGMVAPRIAVVGAGSLGLLWAAHLQARHAVCLVRRPGTAPARCAYRLRRPEGGERAVDVPCYPSDSLPASTLLVLAATKAQDVEQALAPLFFDLAPDVPVVLFQNGLGPHLAMARHYPERALLAASTTEGANRPGPGLVVHAGRGRTWVGGLTAHGNRRVADVAAALGASGLAVQASDDILPRLWRKLAVNAGINPFTALLSCRNGELLGQSRFEALLPALCREVSAVAAAHGQALDAERLADDIRAVARDTADNISSMLQDVRAGKRTEIEHINGFIVAEGERLHIPTPVNRKLVAEVNALPD